MNTERGSLSAPDICSTQCSLPLEQTSIMAWCLTSFLRSGQPSPPGRPPSLLVTTVGTAALSFATRLLFSCIRAGVGASPYPNYSWASLRRYSTHRRVIPASDYPISLAPPQSASSMRSSTAHYDLYARRQYPRKKARWQGERSLSGAEP